MFQFHDIDRHALTVLGPRPVGWTDMPSLERDANAWIERLRARRVAEAERMGPLSSLHAHVDRMVRTDRPEHLDEPEFPADDKLKLVHALHRMNIATRAYWRFTRVLRPWIERVAAREGRPARLLELASGSGEFTLALAKAARDARLPVAITGSDYIPEYVARAREKARARGLDVRFEVVNAFDMSDCPAGAWDLVFIAQSAHHFTAGQLAMMIAQSRRMATTAFVAVDGRRSLQLLAFVPLAAALTGDLHLVHDGAVTARKLFTETELAEIARVAAPDAAVTVAHRRPGYSVLTASWAP